MKCRKNVFEVNVQIKFTFEEKKITEICGSTLKFENEY